MYNRVINKVQNGSIVLFHNGVENTPKALDKILAKLKADGYESVTASKLIYWDNYCSMLVGTTSFEGVRLSNSSIFSFIPAAPRTLKSL